MTRTKLTAVLCIVTATAATAALVGAAASHADVRSRAGTPANHPTHFAGFPPVGVKASTPTTGRLLISFMAHGGCLAFHRLERVCRRTDHLAEVDFSPATPRSFPMEREGSTRATSSSGSPSRVCNSSSRRSLRPACSSTTSGSLSGGTRWVLYQVREVIEW